MAGTGIANAKKLIADINKKKATWNECSNFTLKGVKNLSMSDMDTLEFYAEAFIKSDGYGFPGLMKPLGEVGEVLEKYGITPTIDF